jgi:hypothetical protein
VSTDDTARVRDLVAAARAQLGARNGDRVHLPGTWQRTPTKTPKPQTRKDI